MKGNSNHGSIVPLNLYLRQPLVETTVKSETHAERAARHARADTPPTRWGMFNGAVAATSPGPAYELSPPLVLAVSKAVTDPHLAGGGDVEHTPRKRDPHSGEFTATPMAGPQSTAQDDLAAQERAAKLAQRRTASNLGAAKQHARKAVGDVGAGGGAPQLTRPKPPNPMQQAGVPNAPPGQAGPAAPPKPPPTAVQPDDGGMGAPPGGQGGMSGAPIGPQPIGMTTDGLPIYDDPYNPAHQAFTPEQHKTAAQLHDEQANMMTSTGRIPEALDHQLKGRIHMDLANESQSPMQRMLSSQGMPGQAAGGGQGGAPHGSASNGLESFLSQMSAKQPGSQNAMQPDQNKPTGAPGSPGPMPGMVNTHTGGPVGPQSQQAQHAGTVEQPQAMPPGPAPGAGSMPEISGPQPDALDWDPADFLDDGEGGGAQEAPPTHAGSPTEAAPEPAEEPTPGSTDSEPPAQGAGPSVSDSTPTSKRAEQGDGEEPAPFGGSPTEEHARREQGAVKSITAWFGMF